MKLNVKRSCCTEVCSILELRDNSIDMSGQSPLTTALIGNNFSLSLALELPSTSEYLVPFGYSLPLRPPPLLRYMTWHSLASDQCGSGWFHPSVFSFFLNFLGLRCLLEFSIQISVASTKHLS